MHYLLRRLNLLLFTLVLLSLITFSLSYILPGDQLENLSGQQDLNDTEYYQLQEDYQTNDGYPAQYLAYLSQLFDGNWGVSFTDQSDIFQLIVTQFPATLELTISALFLSITLGIPLGIIAALRYHKKTDHAINLVALSGNSIPVFWLALIMILTFSISFGWLPISGRVSILYEVPHHTGFLIFDILMSNIEDKQQALNSAFRHLILPTLSIAMLTTANLVKLTRSSMLEVMDTQYIKSVRARGISETRLILSHALRNVLIPIIPQLGFQISLLFTAAMVAETIFSWPGIGNWLIQAIFQRDYPAIIGGVLAVSSVIVLMNIVIEICYAFINPAQHRGYHGKA